MTKNVLLKFTKMGINLDPNAYEILAEELSKTEYPEEYLDVLLAIAKYNLKAKGIKPREMLNADADILEFERLK